MVNLSNEQRAHDLALVAVQGEISNAQLGSNNKIDLYATYVEAYSMALKAFNRDFTD